MKATLRVIAIVIPLALAETTAPVAEEAKPQVVRNILERHDQSDVPGKEVVIGTATLPQGGNIGFHTHPGDEAGYVLRGTLILRTRGQPDRILHAGDSFFNPRGAIHSMEARDTDGAAVSAWIIDKGAPLASPAP